MSEPFENLDSENDLDLEIQDQIFLLLQPILVIMRYKSLKEIIDR